VHSFNRRAPIIVSAFFAAAFACSANAEAQSPAADQLITDGMAARRAGDDERALGLFARAWDASRTPRARAQMALAEQALGRFALAEAHLTEALAASNDRWISERRPSLEQSLGAIAARLGSLDVRANAPGVTVTLNGQPAGTLPLERPLRVVSGSVVVEVGGAGFVSATRTVNVQAGALARETFDLVRSATAAQPAQTQPQRTEPAVATTAATRPEPRDDANANDASVDMPDDRAPAADAAPARSGSALPIVGWVGVGVGVVGLGLGTVFALQGQPAADRWNDDARCLAGGASREMNCSADRKDAEQAQFLSTLSFVVGGAFLATGLALVLFTGGSDDDSAASAAFASCAPAFGVVNGVACSGRF